MLNGKDVILILSSIIIVSLLVGLYFLVDTGSKNLNDDFFVKKNSLTGEDNKETNSIENTTDNISSNEEGDLGGGTSGGSTELVEETCEEQTEISYSIINFNKTETCNELQGEICVDKTINCDFDVYNREDSISGFFKLQIFFVEKGLSKEESFEDIFSTFFLEPKTYKKVVAFANVLSSGEEGIANKNITCLYETLEVPMKCI